MRASVWKSRAGAADRSVAGRQPAVSRTEKREDLLDGVTAILITHGHFDHVTGVPELARSWVCRSTASPI
jgi:phosphoribosyl 1,2-cyclic phosphodiesterase